MCGEELAFLIVQDFKHSELRVQINDSWTGISFNLHPSKLPKPIPRYVMLGDGVGLFLFEATM